MKDFGLVQSRVEFEESTHQYTLDGERLVGITGLIHSVLGIGDYGEASEYVQDIAVPRAGSKGTAVHHAIQTHDSLGIRQPIQSVITQYGCKERNNLKIIEETWDVSSQLDSYIKHLDGFKPLENEYTVSDNQKYASQIDNVWVKEDTEGIWLVDTKTNNISLYPRRAYFIDDYFNSGEEALKEYLSWQLSIYAVLFELQNPHLKVEGLACNWLRDSGSRFWIIERKPDEIVRKLLNNDFFIDDYGKIVYIGSDIEDIMGNSLVKVKDKLQIVPEDFINLIYNVQKQYEDAEEKLKEMKEHMRKAMEKVGMKSFDSGKFKATIAVDSVSSSFDSNRFKKDFPELYKTYLVEKTRKGGFTIKLKEIS